MNETSQEVTLNDLALMVKKGFDESYKYMDRKFEAIDRRFDILEDKFDNLENTTYKDHGPRIRRIENKLQLV